MEGCGLLNLGSSTRLNTPKPMMVNLDGEKTQIGVSKCGCGVNLVKDRLSMAKKMIAANTAGWRKNDAKAAKKKTTRPAIQCKWAVACKAPNNM